MVRKKRQPQATKEEILECVQKHCPECGLSMWNKYDNHRHVRTLEGVVPIRFG